MDTTDVDSVQTGTDTPALSGHVLVCGARGVALRAIEQLRSAGAGVVVVADTADVSPVAARLLTRWQVPRIPGRSRDALVAAGIADAQAVVCAPDDDLIALETALLVRRLRPDIRLVVQMGNAAVGRELAEVTGVGSVFDVATLAAPGIVEVCLGQRPHPIALAGKGFAAAELIADRDGTLRELFGELAPLAVAGARPVICPGRDHRVRIGDAVTVVGTAEQFAAIGADHIVTRLHPLQQATVAAGARVGAAARAAQREEVGGRPGLFALLRSLVAEADRPLRTTVLILAVLLVVSVVVLRLGYVKPDGSSMSVLDAVYFTIETIGTIGYGDFSFAEQSTVLRIFAIGLMLGGVLLATVVFALLTQLLVSNRIERSFGQRRVGAMRGHVIVVGLGAIGMRVTEGLLAAGARVAVLERDEQNRHLARARELNVPLVIGDATDPAVLAAANLSSAAAIAVLTSDDLANIETGLAVRDQLGDRFETVPVVLRVFDRELGEAVEDGFGFRFVRSAAVLAAPWFVGASLGLAVLGTFYVDRTPFLIGRLSVAPGGGLDGLAMGELAARTRVVAIHRASAAGARELEYPPRSGTRFAPGDDAYLVGPYEELLAVLRRDAPEQ